MMKGTGGRGLWEGNRGKENWRKGTVGRDFSTTSASGLAAALLPEIGGMGA